MKYLTILTIILTSNTFAHSGRTNSSGCHNDRNTGGYHCHKGKVSTSSGRKVAYIDIKDELNHKVKNLLSIGIQMMELRNSGNEGIRKCRSMMKKYKPQLKVLEEKLFNTPNLDMEFKTVVTNLKFCLVCIGDDSDSNCEEAGVFLKK